MRKSKSFESIRRQYFYPELKRCPYCRRRLRLLPGLYLKKTIQTLNGALWLGGYAAHCVNPKCQHRKTHYLSTQLATLSLPEVTLRLRSGQALWLGCDRARWLAASTRSPHHE